MSWDFGNHMQKQTSVCKISTFCDSLYPVLIIYGNEYFYHSIFMDLNSKAYSSVWFTAEFEPC